MNHVRYFIFLLNCISTSYCVMAINISLSAIGIIIEFYKKSILFLNICSGFFLRVPYTLNCFQLKVRPFGTIPE